MKCLAALLVFLLTQNAFAEPKEPDYADITETIRTRIIALKQQHPVLEKMGDSPRGIGLQHAVKWKLDDPTLGQIKGNPLRPIYESDDAFYIHVTFYRGPYGGTAGHRPIRFGDLRVWIRYGYNKDATVIGAITKVIREEKKRDLSSKQYGALIGMPMPKMLWLTSPTTRRIHQASWPYVPCCLVQISTRTCHSLSKMYSPKKRG